LLRDYGPSGTWLGSQSRLAPILVVFTAIIGMLLGALGGRLRGAAMQRRGLPAPPTRRTA
jgi:hypothetical protein